MTVKAIYRAGPAYGLGHKRRALTLARALRQVPELRRKRVTILDYPGISPSTVRRLRERGQLVVVLGAEYQTDCPETEPSLQIIPAFSYVNPGSKGPPFLAGPGVPILGPEYRGLAPKEIRPEVECLLITVGGSDDNTALAARLAMAACSLSYTLKIRVVQGPYFPFGARVLLRWAARKWPRQIEVVRRPKTLLPLLQWCDVVVAAAGGTLFELSATGTPALVVQAGPDQEENAERFAFAMNAPRIEIGTAGEFWPGDWLGEMRDAIRRALAELTPDRRLAMSRRMQEWVDGCGTDRAVSEIMRLAGV